VLFSGVHTCVSRDDALSNKCNVVLFVLVRKRSILSLFHPAIRNLALYVHLALNEPPCTILSTDMILENRVNQSMFSLLNTTCLELYELNGAFFRSSYMCKPWRCTQELYINVIRKFIQYMSASAQLTHACTSEKKHLILLWRHCK
jgi:hypothetical protein